MTDDAAPDTESAAAEAPVRLTVDGVEYELVPHERRTFDHDLYVRGVVVGANADRYAGLFEGEDEDTFDLAVRTVTQQLLDSGRACDLLAAHFTVAGRRWSRSAAPGVAKNLADTTDAAARETLMALVGAMVSGFFRTRRVSSSTSPTSSPSAAATVAPATDAPAAPATTDATTSSSGASLATVPG